MLKTRNQGFGVNESNHQYAITQAKQRFVGYYCLKTPIMEYFSLFHFSFHSCHTFQFVQPPFSISSNLASSIFFF